MVKEYRKKWRKTEPVRVPDPSENVEDVLAAELGAEPVELVEWISFRIKAITGTTPKRRHYS